VCFGPDHGSGATFEIFIFGYGASHFLDTVQATSLKEEVVYVRLSNNGSVDETYVVNSFELGSDKQITDYGNYAYVQPIRIHCCFMTVWSPSTHKQTGCIMRVSS